MSGLLRVDADENDEVLVDEMIVRQWFKQVDIEQARDTFRVVEGILEMRGESKRKRRSDAGTTRAPKPLDAQGVLPGGFGKVSIP
jgi:hypothetical protein